MKPPFLLNADHAIGRRPGLWRAVAVALVLCCAGASAAEIAPDDAKKLVAAQQAFDARKFDQAVRILLPLRAKYPDFGDIPRLLTHAYYELGQFDPARQAALQAIGSGRFAADVLVRVAQIDQQRGDKHSLINVVRLLTILEPENRQWRPLYADLLAGTDAVKESVAACQALLDEEPNSAELHLRLAQSLVKLDRPSEAAAAFETAWHLGAQDERLPLMLAGVWQSLGDDRQALAWLERAETLAPATDPKQKLNRANLLWKLGELDRAAATAAELSKSADNSVQGQAQVLLGRIAMRQNRLDAAIEHWRQAAAAGVDSPELLTVLGMHQFNCGKYAAAAKILRRVVDREDAENEQNLRHLIASLAHAQQSAAAKTYLTKYIERHGLGDHTIKLVQLVARQDRETSAVTTQLPPARRTD
jgi:predicted Zn-dependent protease